MAILGYNTKGASLQGTVAGMKRCSKWTLAAPATLTELHGWFSGAGTNVLLFIYADSSGVPGARVAYSSPFALTSGSDVELSQTGFSVALAAGDYWIGFSAEGSGGGWFRETSGGFHSGTDSVTFNPPGNPFETPNTSGSQRYSAWAVVGAAASTFAPRVIAYT